MLNSAGQAVKRVARLETDLKFFHCQGLTGVLSTAVKSLGYEAYPSPHTIEVINEWIYTSTPTSPQCGDLPHTKVYLYSRWRPGQFSGVFLPVIYIITHYHHSMWRFPSQSTESEHAIKHTERFIQLNTRNTIARLYRLCVRSKEIITGAQSQSCGRSTSSCSSTVGWPHPAIPIQRENGQMRTHKCVFRHSDFHCSAVSWTSVMCDWQWTDSLCRRHGDQPPGGKKEDNRAAFIPAALRW